MAILQPSQYQYNHMQPDDILVIKKRNFFYTIFRKLFLNNKNQIVINNKTSGSVKCYQEDCLIIPSYELKCTRCFDDEVFCNINWKGSTLRRL